jgi:hypothetical protein
MANSFSLNVKTERLELKGEFLENGIAYDIFLQEYNAKIGSISIASSTYLNFDGQFLNLSLLPEYNKYTFAKEVCNVVFEGFFQRDKGESFYIAVYPAKEKVLYNIAEKFNARFLEAKDTKEGWCELYRVIENSLLPVETVIVVRAVVFNSKNELLFVSTNGVGWHFPGGEVSKAESARDIAGTRSI